MRPAGKTLGIVGTVAMVLSLGNEPTNAKAQTPPVPEGTVRAAASLPTDRVVTGITPATTSAGPAAKAVNTGASLSTRRRLRVLLGLVRQGDPDAGRHLPTDPSTGRADFPGSKPWLRPTR